MMRVDYGAIADRAVALLGAADPNRYEDAFQVMIGETVEGPAEGRRITSRDIAAQLGLADGKIFLDALRETIAAGDLMPEVLDWLAPEQGGLDATDPAVQQGLALVGGEPRVTPAMVDAVLALAVEVKPAWPGLKRGHVQNALQRRAEGEL
jgi:hypothetical protein